MINKNMFKITILFFLCIFTNYAFADEQFKFEITEIEILENGNKIIGKNREKYLLTMELYLKQINLYILKILTY